MSNSCECAQRGFRRKIVLTGGPGAGKTGVLELVRQSLCDHVVILPEAAGILFGGGFPRSDELGVRRAAQRAIFHVQCELESATHAKGGRVMLCDRGAVDGFAYWPGPSDFWLAVRMTRQAALKRYDAVIHLRVPDAEHGYGHQNPLRTESALEAQRIDERILDAWAGHPRRIIIDANVEFLEKARQTLQVLTDLLPECCKVHPAPELTVQHA